MATGSQRIIIETSRSAPQAPRLLTCTVSSALPARWWPPRRSFACSVFNANRWRLAHARELRGARSDGGNLHHARHSEQREAARPLASRGACDKGSITVRAGRSSTSAHSPGSLSALAYRTRTRPRRPSSSIARPSLSLCRARVGPSCPPFESRSLTLRTSQDSARARRQLSAREPPPDIAKSAQRPAYLCVLARYRLYKLLLSTGEVGATVRWRGAGQRRRRAACATREPISLRCKVAIFWMESSHERHPSCAWQKCCD